MRCSIGMARITEPAYSTTWPRAPATPISAMIRSATSLAVTCGDELAVEPHQHPLRPLHRHHLRRENMRELRRAAAERQRADAADRAGVTVGHRVRRARQHHAELRRDDVRNALLGIVKIEHLDVVLGAALAHRLEKRRARRIGVVVAARLGRNGVIQRRERQIGPPHRPLLLFQLFKRVRRVQLVQHMAVDVDQLAAVGAAARPDESSQIFSNRVRGMARAFDSWPPSWSPAQSKASALARRWRARLGSAASQGGLHDDAPQPDHAPHTDAAAPPRPPPSA